MSREDQHDLLVHMDKQRAASRAPPPSRHDVIQSLPAAWPGDATDEEDVQERERYVHIVVESNVMVMLFAQLCVAVATQHGPAAAIGGGTPSCDAIAVSAAGGGGCGCPRGRGAGPGASQPRPRSSRSIGCVCTQQCPVTLIDWLNQGRRSHRWPSASMPRARHPSCPTSITPRQVWRGIGNRCMHSFQWQSGRTGTPSCSSLSSHSRNRKRFP